MAECTHKNQIKEGIKPKSETCLECKSANQRPFSLRVCLACGNVGCCDSSSGKHARKHWEKTGHPIMEPLGHGWKWCYPDDKYID